jgi:hypothetical protein
MGRGKIALFVVGFSIAFALGYYVRGFQPELSCKENGGYYSEAIRTCMYVEPTEAYLRQESTDALRHLKGRC